MIVKLLLGGALGIVIGAATGWFFFNTIASAVGLGCSLASGICGALLSRRPKDNIR